MPAESSNSQKPSYHRGAVLLLQIQKRKVLFLQLLFVTLAFALMILSSSLFVRNMLKNHLSKDAEALLTQKKLKIESELVEAQATLHIVSNTVRMIILQGGSADEVFDYLRNIHHEMDKKMGGFIFDGFFSYFEVFGGVFFHSGGWESEDFEATDRPWYEVALEAGSQMAVTPIYYSPRTFQYDITYVHRIFNNEDVPLAMVCLNVPLERIREYVMNMQIAEGGYGILLSENIEVIAHHSPEFIGKPAREISPGFSSISQELEMGNDIFEREFDNYQNQWTVASTMRLDNGWVLTLMTPKAVYYRQMHRMMFIISILGVSFTIVLIIILIRIDIAKNKADEQSSQKSALLAEMEKQREADKRTRVILDATPMGCLLVDRELNVIESNQEALHLFDLHDKKELSNIFLKFSPEYQPDGRLSNEKALDVVRRSFDEGYCRFEWVHQKLDGELIPSNITLVRVKYMDEYAVAGFIWDLREYNKVLTQLELALKEAQEASMAKSKFLATMSHEIRTPMNVILGVTESNLENQKLSQDIREGYEKIYTSADLLLHIINDILDLSKIETGKLELNPAKYCIQSLINDAANLNISRFQHKPIKFSLYVDENIPSEMIGDELRIKQILNNLLTNAFKYTDSGDVKLSFSIESSTQNQDDIMLVLCVSDTGRGMSPEEVEKLFDEYTQFNLESNRTTMGTGLGMSITRNLLKLMDGVMSVDSTSGKGTTVTAHIPQKINSSDVLGKKVAEDLQNFIFTNTEKTKKKKIVREPMPYGKVLVVDDMVSNLDVAKLLLTPYQIQIDTVESGFEAIDLINNGKEYDIIFMDHMMPNMDGLETTKKLRESGYKHPIIALTANAVVGQQEIFLANGFDAFMSKPIDIRQLNDSLIKYIRDKVR